jgi:hypothetical protein
MARPLFLTLLMAALIACGIVVSSCGGPEETDKADKCKLPDLAPGEIPSPDELLPPREDCPELYEGREGPPTAPPGGPAVSPPSPGGGPGIDPGGPEICATPEQRTPCIPDCRTTGAC